MKIVMSPEVQKKLDTKHNGVTADDVFQCFANRSDVELIDGRAEHLTNPVTRWFIAETDFGKVLKICFMQYQDRIVIKTAYKPNQEEIRIYAGASK